MAASGDFLGRFWAASGKARALPSQPVPLEEARSREDGWRRLPEGGEAGPRGFPPPGLVLVRVRSAEGPQPSPAGLRGEGEDLKGWGGGGGRETGQPRPNSDK